MAKTRIPVVLPVRLRVPSIFRKAHLIGASPGSLAVTPSAPKPTIRVIQYDAEGVTDRGATNLADIRGISRETGVTWIDVQGLGDEAILRGIAELFGIHPLALEDMVNVPQRPKIVDYDDRLLWVARMVRIDEHGVIDREQVSILHDHRLLITFQERPGDVFDSIRRRIHEGRGLMRKSNADYLAYALLDTVVDGYYPIVEKISRAMEELETQVMANPNPEQLTAINQTKLLSTTIKRGLVAQRASLREYLGSPTGHVSPAHLVYLKDVLDHTNQLCDVMDNQRELLAGLLNTYLSVVSFRANEVMKVLTIMASIFIPLTFIAGIYGMNFQYMPELAYPWAYPVALGAMVVVALGMVGYFAKKGWIFSSQVGTPRRTLELDSHEDSAATGEQRQRDS